MVIKHASTLIFDKQDIPDTGLDIDRCEDSCCFEFDDYDFKLNDSVKIKGHLTQSGELIYFRGEFAASIILTCARCLKNFHSSIQSALRIDFSPKDDAPKEEEIELELELESSDLDVYYYEKGEINLFEAIRDQIVISIPIKPLCDINCAGLCSHCGQDLNDKKCDCLDQFKIDPRLAPLEKFKHLKEKL